MKCQICEREMVESIRTDEDPWQWEMFYNCGGDCSGCVAVAEDRAVYAYCEFHDNVCVVWKHYGESTHLCDPQECIEVQDITTLMLNAAYQHWQDGETNQFFDRLIKAADDVRSGENLGDKSDDEIIDILSRPSPEK